MYELLVYGLELIQLIIVEVISNDEIIINSLILEMLVHIVNQMQLDTDREIITQIAPSVEIQMVGIVATTKIYGEIQLIQ